MKVAKSIGVISIIAGIIMIVAGAVTWTMISSQLAAEKITVAQDSRMFAGEPVDGPLSAYFEAETVNHHALGMGKGKTYAEISNEVYAAKESGDTAKVEELQALSDQLMTASFTRASLLTSVISFGVAALVMGLGLMFALLGWAFLAVKAPKAEAVRATA